MSATNNILRWNLVFSLIIILSTGIPQTQGCCQSSCATDSCCISCYTRCRTCDCTRICQRKVKIDCRYSTCESRSTTTSSRDSNRTKAPTTQPTADEETEEIFESLMSDENHNSINNTIKIENTVKNENVITGNINVQSTNVNNIKGIAFEEESGSEEVVTEAEVNKDEEHTGKAKAQTNVTVVHVHVPYPVKSPVYIPSYVPHFMPRFESHFEPQFKPQFEPHFMPHSMRPYGPQQCCIIIQPCVTQGCQPYRFSCDHSCRIGYMPQDPCMGACYRRSYWRRQVCFGYGYCGQKTVDCSTCGYDFYQSYEGWNQCQGCFYR